MSQSCEHLKSVSEDDFPAPREPIACEECLKEGTRWVALRQCLSCGQVGCCDSSPGKHATRHFHETRHPVMRSIMDGDQWAWCYEHEVLSELARAHAVNKKETQPYG